MTPKEWFALLLFYAAYLFMGASVFYHVENDLETERRAEELAERIEINGKCASWEKRQAKTEKRKWMNGWPILCAYIFRSASVYRIVNIAYV